MSDSTVYFARTGVSNGKGILEKLHLLFSKAGFADAVEKRNLVAIKLHFGEMGCSTFIPAIFIREIVQEYLDLDARPFLTDSGVLYLGQRRNARDHLITANAHGFSLATTGAPVVIADGLLGSDVFPVGIGGDYFDEVDVAGTVAHCDSLAVVSHITGHGLTGFAGAFKNLGMGCVGRKVKLSIHELVKPVVNGEKCDGCATCMKYCPTDAISIDKESKVAVIDLFKCIGCGECMEACPNQAVAIEWKGDSEKAQEKLVEAASAVIRAKENPIAYFNFVINLTPNCDCFPRSSAVMVPDIGVLASTDPVSIDQAAADLVMDAPAAREKYTDTGKRFSPLAGGSWERTLEFAQKMGLGSRSYELREI